MESKERKQWREPTDGDLWEFIVEVDHTTQVLIGAFEKCTFGEKLTKGVGDIEPDKIAILHFLQKLNKGACQIIEHRIPIDAGSAIGEETATPLRSDFFVDLPEEALTHLETFAGILMGKDIALLSDDTYSNIGYMILREVKGLREWLYSDVYKGKKAPGTTQPHSEV